MKCGDTGRHNISELNSGLSVNLLQLPLQGSGKALGDNLEEACSIFLQKSFILVRRIYWNFRLLRGGWLGCTRAFIEWHLWPYPLKLSLWSTATTHPDCHCTPRQPRTRARSPRLVKPRHGWLGLAWYGMVWLGARARCFPNEVRLYLPTQYLKNELGTFFQVIAAPPSGFREGIRRQFSRGMFHIFAKGFRFGTPHLLDFQVAVWWLARLYACFRKVAALALPVEVFALVHCHHTPTLPLHPPPPARGHARLVSSSQGMTGLAWHGMVWYGLVREPGAFIMKCGDTCRHNISKLNLGLSVTLLQLPLQGSGKALGDNLEGACSIFLQKHFILVRHIYWIFRLLRGGWVGCTPRDTPTQNYPHLTEEDMPGIQRCFFRTFDYLQQTHPHVLEQIWPPPG